MMTYEQAVATAMLQARGDALALQWIHAGFEVKIAKLALRRLRVRAGLVP